MKKPKLIIFPIITLFFILAAARLSFGATINVSRAKDGLVSFEYSGDMKSKEIHAILELPNVARATPRIFTNPSVLPLNFGVGTYEFKIVEKLPNGKQTVLSGKDITKAQLSADPDELIMYTASTINANFDVSVHAVPSFKKISDGLADAEKIGVIYEEVVNSYVYDYDKAKSVVNKTITPGYLPDIDDIYAIKKGICYDFSAVFAGALRSQGFPAKVVKGFSADLGDGLHAWNEVYVDGKWVVVDTTYDSALAAAKMDYSFAKDANKFTVKSYH